MNLLVCEVCLESYNHDNRRPHCLTCGHSFCGRCIGNLLGWGLKCPTCRVIHKGEVNDVNDIPVNFAILFLLKDGSEEPLHRDDTEATCIKSRALDDRIKSLRVWLAEFRGEVGRNERVTEETTEFLKYLEELQLMMQKEMARLEESVEKAVAVKESLKEEPSMKHEILKESTTTLGRGQMTPSHQGQPNRSSFGTSEILDKWQQLFVSRKILGNSLKIHSEWEAFMGRFKSQMIYPQSNLQSAQPLRGSRRAEVQAMAIEPFEDYSHIVMEGRGNQEMRQPNVSGVRWERFRPGSVMTAPVPTMTSVDAPPPLVAAAFHEGGLIPGQMTPGANACEIPWGTQALRKQDFYILSNPSNLELVWQSASNGEVPEGALKGCTTEYRVEDLYIARCEKNGTLISGKVHPSHEVCYVPYEGQELNSHVYEVLCLKATTRQENQNVSEARSSLQERMSLLRCEVCLENYNSDDHRPHTLTCGHSFCRSCLGHLLNGVGHLICPNCRVAYKDQVNNVNDVPVNFAISSLLQAFHKSPPLDDTKASRVEIKALDDRIKSLRVRVADFRSEVETNEEVSVEIAEFLKYLKEIKKLIQQEVTKLEESLEEAVAVKESLLEGSSKKQKTMKEITTATTTTLMREMMTSSQEGESNRSSSGTSETFSKWQQMFLSRKVLENAQKVHCEWKAFLTGVEDQRNDTL